MNEEKLEKEIEEIEEILNEFKMVAPLIISNDNQQLDWVKMQARQLSLVKDNLTEILNEEINQTNP